MNTQRDVQGSAHANAWRHALGEELPEEIIILPDEGPKSVNVRHTGEAVQWESELALNVFPNPTAGAAFAAYEVPEDMEQAELRLTDVHGRVLVNQRLADGPGLAQLSNTGLAAGVYMVNLQLDGQILARTKLIVQR